MNDSDSAIFCTAFDQRYLSRGLVMIESLRPHLIHKQKIVILSLDFESWNYLKGKFGNDDSVEIMTLTDFSEIDFWLIRRTRTYKEFCWSLGAVLSNVLILRENKMTVYVDADTCFFSSPQEILSRCSSANSSITPHRFPKRLSYLEVNGKYNVGWVSFTPTPIGIAISTEWRRNCQESTSSDAKAGIFGDQKYLDSWGITYPGVLVLSDPGVNAGPWNHEGHNFSLRDGAWFVDNSPLIFFHFHAFKTLKDGSVSPAPHIYRAAKEIPTALYVQYFSLVSSAEREIGSWIDAPVAKRLVLNEHSMLSTLARSMSSLLKRVLN